MADVCLCLHTKRSIKRVQSKMRCLLLQMNLILCTYFARCVHASMLNAFLAIVQTPLYSIIDHFPSTCCCISLSLKLFFVLRFKLICSVSFVVMYSDFHIYFFISNNMLPICSPIPLSVCLVPFNLQLS